MFVNCNAQIGGTQQGIAKSGAGVSQYNAMELAVDGLFLSENTKVGSMWDREWQGC